ncbi:MAG: L-threonylcarbamoyladenylate synthase [bacterium]
MSLVKTKVIKVSRGFPEWNAIRLARSVLLSGGLVCFPTDTTYGISCIIYSDSAIENLRRIKARVKDQPFLILASDMGMVRELVGGINRTQRKLIDLYWPGPLTIVFSASKGLPSYLRNPWGTVAVRIPKDALTQSIVQACGMPLVAPSANLRGEQPAITFEQAFKVFSGLVDLILDGGTLESALPSTVVDARSGVIRVLRKGRLALAT